MTAPSAASGAEAESLSSTLLAWSRSLVESTPTLHLAGARGRAIALLTRQALEQGLAQFWERRGLALAPCSLRAQLLCLRDYAGADVAATLDHAWVTLSQICHHHPFELTPSADELRSWIGTVEDALSHLAAE